MRDIGRKRAFWNIVREVGNGRQCNAPGEYAGRMPFLNQSFQRIIFVRMIDFYERSTDAAAQTSLSGRPGLKLRLDRGLVD
ncbi:hypothetical protein, partial [Mesorhizobium sp. M7A.F.Ca.US.001.02.1.1]|uniref:hypothetical protein n=1 Tax=Mesorhizobium sp. M7A.F.Ca.US.001.02.1.1 TaxID=2496703 RepID=UPI0019D48447